MIVVPDANALVSVPFSNASWHILGLAGTRWKVYVIIPRVALAEAVAHAERALDADLAAIEQLNRKHAKAPGLREASEYLAAKRVGRAAQFEKDADAVAIEVIDPPDVPVMEMVRRQTSRQAPCKKDGSGYRDTLNWLTVLDIAAAWPDEQVVLVTTDKDFGKGRELHPELMAEAAARGVGERILLRPSIGMVVQELLTEHALPTNSLDARAHLATEAVRSFAAMILIDVFEEGEPRFAAFENFEVLEKNVEVGPRSVIEEGGSVWPVEATARAIIGNVAFDFSATALVTTDQFDQPYAIEVTEIEVPFEPVITAISLAREADPDLSGEKLVRALRLMGALPQTPFPVRRALAGPGAFHLGKPDTPD